jgi:hypothetical protein
MDKDTLYLAAVVDVEAERRMVDRGKRRVEDGSARYPVTAPLEIIIRIRIL